MGAMIKQGDTVKHHPISCEPSPGGDAETTAEHIKLKMRILACLTAGLTLQFSKLNHNYTEF